MIDQVTIDDGIYAVWKESLDNYYDQGYRDGKEEGLSDGYDEGWTDGYKAAMAEMEGE